jgi:hypothetical protein
MMAGGSTETGASRAMLELKLLENTVLDDICVEDCVVDGVCDDWVGLKRLKDCTPKLGLETSPLERLVLLENTVLDGALLEFCVLDGVPGAVTVVGSAAEGTLEPGAVTARGSTRTVVLRGVVGASSGMVPEMESGCQGARLVMVLHSGWTGPRNESSSLFRVPHGVFQSQKDRMKYNPWFHAS